MITPVPLVEVVLSCIKALLGMGPHQALAFLTLLVEAVQAPHQSARTATRLSHAGKRSLAETLRSNLPQVVLLFVCFQTNLENMLQNPLLITVCTSVPREEAVQCSIQDHLEEEQHLVLASLLTLEDPVVGLLQSARSVRML